MHFFQYVIVVVTVMKKWIERNYRCGIEFWLHYTSTKTSLLPFAFLWLVPFHSLAWKLTFSSTPCQATLLSLWILFPNQSAPIFDQFLLQDYKNRTERWCHRDEEFAVSISKFFCARHQPTVATCRPFQILMSSPWVGRVVLFFSLNTTRWYTTMISRQ